MLNNPALNPSDGFTDADIVVVPLRLSVTVLFPEPPVLLIVNEYTLKGNPVPVIWFATPV